MNRIFRKLALSSSVALALGGIGAGFAAPSPQDTQQVADARRETQILTSFNMNRYLRTFDLSVVVDGNKAVLTGTVSDGICKELAGQIAKNANGITQVDNHIAVDADATSKSDKTKVGSSAAQAEQAMSDSWITAKVKASLMLTDRVDRFEIAVTTSNGVVSLKGVVDSMAERELAVQVAQDIHGVKKVEADGLTAG